jgi:hypothetical protein
VIRIALAAFLLVSCKSSDKAAPPAEAKPAPKTAWAKRETADCPAYPGKAAVTVTDIDGGYTVAIATTDESAVGDIRENARYVESAAAAGAGSAALTFDRTMGNRTANCPVILEGATITVVDQPGGAIVTVKAKDPANVDALRKEAREKAETLVIMREAMKDTMK